MVAGPAGQVVASYCVGCGKGLISTAAICPSCGTPVRTNSGSRGRDKTVAILLAVFLSGWAWLYTYRVNAAKFWIYIAVSFVFFVIFIPVWAASDDLLDPAAVLGLVLNYLVAFGFWVWAIIDVATKPREYYENYE